MLKNDLLDLLTIVKPGLATKELIEFSTSFMFTNGRVLTFNDELCVSAPLPDEIKEIKGAVDASSLYDLVKGAEDQFEVKQTKKEIKITGEDFKAGIRTKQMEHAPSIEMPKRWYALGKGFPTAIETTMMSAGQDMTQPLLTCLHITEDRIEACDNFRLTIYHCETGVKEPMVMPAKHARILLNYPVTKFGRTQGWLHFKTKKGVCFSCRTYAETYPDLSGLIEEEGTPVQLPSRLIKTLENAGVFVNDDSKLQASVTLRFGKKLIVRSENDSGWFEGSCPIKYKGDPVAIRINPYMLADVLSFKGRLRICSRSLVFKTKTFIHQVSMDSDAGEEAEE